MNLPPEVAIKIREYLDIGGTSTVLYCILAVPEYLTANAGYKSVDSYKLAANKCNDANMLISLVSNCWLLALSSFRIKQCFYS
jgi:hypothetical protein